jgi:hypothetical protein
MKSEIYDCLKYWKVIRYFIKRKYGLTTGDLDMLLFLNSEDIFSRDKFEEFDNLLVWDKNRFNRLLQDGWIEVWGKIKRKNHKKIYSVTFKTQRLINSIYKKLSGEEIPTSENGNPIFAKNVKFTDKVYRKMILEMNKSIRQQRRLSPE